jgi:D-beta-D-heptose 7-phosphate kinase/D-beta-D-heptose 1-phosphate adenosyltransferase
MHLSDVVKQFRNKRILVIGDAIIDHYIYGTASRISPDAPVPLLNIHEEQRQIGSLGKVTDYILALGGDVEVISCVGKDFEGQFLLNQLKEQNIGLKGLIEMDILTPRITRIIAQKQQLLRLEKRYQFTREQKENLIGTIEQFLTERMDRYDAVVILDYDSDFLNSILISHILAIASEKKKKIIVRPEEQKYLHYRNTFLVIMNRNIASKATGIQPLNDTGMRILGTKLLNELHSESLLIPWIEGETYLFNADNVYIHPSLLKFPARMTGNIGSMVIAAAAMGSACDIPITDVIKIAHYAGSLAAQQEINKEFVAALQSVIEHGSLPTH